MAGDRLATLPRMPNPFLSEEWMADVRAIRERYAGETPPVTTSLKINQIVTDVPFGDGRVETYVDTSSGHVVMRRIWSTERS